MAGDPALAVVFESAYDAHISKDIVAVPVHLSKLLGGIPVYLVTRPNTVQRQLAEKLRIVPLGNEIAGNNQALESRKEEEVRYSADWYHSACLRAADVANYLFLVPHFGDPLRGSLAFSRKNRSAGAKSATYLKLDANVEVLRQELQRRKSQSGIKPVLRRWNESIRSTIVGRAITAISAESSETLELFRKLQPQFSSRCHLVKNCPVFSAADTGETRPIAVRNKAFLAVGRLGSPAKATDTLLASWILAAESCPDWCLRLVGSVEEGFREHWEPQLRARGLQDRVQWLGVVSERDRLWEIYSDSRVFVLPSRWESSSTTMVEAITAGCGLICTRAGDAALILGPESPCLVPIDEPSALASAMVAVATSDTLLAGQIRHLSVEARDRRWQIQLQPIARSLAAAIG